MKLIHLSDLHLGKKLNEFSLYEDQKYILHQIVEIVVREQSDAVLIAGDVYDKAVPPAEAVQLFDWFLTQLAERRIPVFIISGNHDSAERLSFGARLMQGSGVYFSPTYNGEQYKVTLRDAVGAVNIYLLPFVKPAHIKRFLPEDEAEQITSYHTAVHAAIAIMKVDVSERNVLVAHQFVTGALKCDSEDVSVGGMDNIGAEVFADFDYVALGHIHSPQNIKGNEQIRYCGTPLKYSFSEAGQQKSVTVVELEGKGVVRIHTIDLVPLRDLRKLRGSYAALTLRENYVNTNTQDFIHITLTDEEDIPNALAKLRVIYPNLLQLEYDNARTRSSKTVALTNALEQKSELELFAEFYQQQNAQELSSVQLEQVQQLIVKLKGAEQ